jgi:hypothetical protein
MIQYLITISDTDVKKDKYVNCIRHQEIYIDLQDAHPPSLLLIPRLRGLAL